MRRSRGLGAVPVLAQDAAQVAKGKTVYDWMHYVPLLQRKPGALRNGAPFKDLPEPLGRLREALLKDASQLGVTVVTDRAVSIIRRGNRVTGVQGREAYAAASVVIAAGAWSGGLTGLPGRVAPLTGPEPPA